MAFLNHGVRTVFLTEMLMGMALTFSYMFRHRGIFDVETGHQLGLGFGQVEGRAVGLGEP